MVLLSLFDRPHVAPSVEIADVESCGEKIHDMSQFPKREVEEEQDAHYIIKYVNAMACREKQIQHGGQLESGGQEVGDEVVRIRKWLEVFGHGTLHQQQVPACTGDDQQNGDDEMDAVRTAYPAVEKGEEGEHKHQQGGEDAYVKQYSGSV